MNQKISNIDIYFSSDCNLKCQYCYIEKNKEKLHEYNKRIRQEIQSGEYIEKIKHKYKDHLKEITDIGLWGAEPTLNSEFVKKLMEDLVEIFPNFKTIFFSTNSVKGFNGIRPFLEVARDNNLKIKIQFSIDGPKWINDISRGKDVTEKVIQNIKDTFQFMSENKDIEAKFNVKPTLSIENIKKLEENFDLLIEWFSFFDNLQEIVKEDDRFWLLGYPTIVNPGDFTVEDGKIYASFIRQISNIDDNIFKHYKHPLILQPTNNISIDFNNAHIACSAGYNSYSFDNNGTIYSCHRFISNSVLSSNSIDCIESWCFGNNDFDKLKMLNYVYHDNMESRVDIFIIIASALSRYGQIDKSYLNNKDKLLALYSVIAPIMCHFGQAEETKDPLIIQTGYIKLIGNGALEEIYKYARRYKLI